MSKRICRWGNSSGVRIPKSVLSDVDIECDEEIEIKSINLNGVDKGILITKKGIDNEVEGLSKEKIQKILDML